MSGPALWTLPVLPGHAADLELALDALPENAFAWLSPQGKHAVFMGEGELCVFLESTEYALFDKDAWREGDAADLKRVLDAHTAFDAEKPVMWLTRDVHHAGDPVETTNVVPVEN